MAIAAKRQKKDFQQEIERVITPVRLRRITKKLYELAKTGDLEAINTIYDRLLGKPTQRVEAQNVNIDLNKHAELEQRFGIHLIPESDDAPYPHLLGGSPDDGADHQGGYVPELPAPVVERSEPEEDRGEGPPAGVDVDGGLLDDEPQTEAGG